jgi:hypothetical protein
VSDIVSEGVTRKRDNNASDSRPFLGHIRAQADPPLSRSALLIYFYRMEKVALLDSFKSNKRGSDLQVSSPVNSMHMYYQLGFTV